MWFSITPITITHYLIFLFQPTITMHPRTPTYPYAQHRIAEYQYAVVTTPHARKRATFIYLYKPSR